VTFTPALAFVPERPPAPGGQRPRIAQHALELLGDSLGHLILVIDDQGTILFANAATETLLGVEPTHLMGENWTTALWLGDGTSAAAVLAHDGGPTDPVIRACRHRDGSWRAFEWRTQRHRTQSGVFLVQGTTTSRLGADADVPCHTQKMQALGLAAVAIAHDFGNLLTVIKGYAELIQLELSRAADGGGLVPAMTDGVIRAERLVKRLLQFARPDGEHDWQPCDANVVVDDLFSILALMVGRRVRTSCTLDATRARVTLDRCALEQVMLNLCANARDAMPDGGSLHISTLVDEGQPSGLRPVPRRLAIEVTDSGCGMTDEVRSRAFEAFFTTRRGGSGLGLDTVRRLVEGVGGRVDVASVVGQGTTFRLLLPLADDSPALLRHRRMSIDDDAVSGRDTGSGWPSLAPNDGRR
jgi:two-component system cell cycle sensor histidine kinase/response regulator CckA